MGVPIDSADGEAEYEVERDDDVGALYFGADAAADDDPSAEEAEDSARCTDGVTVITEEHR